MDVANASLLDEATAAAEAMTMLHRVHAKRAAANVFVAVSTCFPQTLELLPRGRKPLGVGLRVVSPEALVRGEWRWTTRCSGCTADAGRQRLCRTTRR